MHIARLDITNFRGVSAATLYLPKHAVLVGDNNTGKSTILEAIDLVMGPDRLARRPPVDEHDFFQGKYLAEAAEAQPGAEVPPAPTPAPEITVEVVVIDLSEDQQARFAAYIEWWDTAASKLYDDPNPEGVDAAQIVAALRLSFIGKYDEDEDDFEGASYFARTIEEGEPEVFHKKDKQHCGFLYLRAARTGTRALSLEHGSLLDIILRLKEVRPKMWEDTLSELSGLDVAAKPELGLSGVLTKINDALKHYVPKEWGVEPHLRVSSLTREHLRKVITAFVATGDGAHAAPFYRQGNGTINMLVLAMLSIIAEDKQNVIFAMEEVETAIPPYAQKRIVHEIRKMAAQSIFTSHSPYVLEEFGLEQTVILSRDGDGKLTQAKVVLPDSVKHKKYLQDFRTRFCEGLLSRRVLIAEGATEATSLPAVARRLHELAPATYTSFEGLGICTMDAGTQNQIADLAELYRSLGKKVFAACDKQEAAAQAAIEAKVDKLFMHAEKGFENLVLKNTSQAALERFCDALQWPPHLSQKYPNPKANAAAALSDYFQWSKGNWGVADFLTQCTEAEIPLWLRDMCKELAKLCNPPPAVAAPAAGAANGA
ncbi:AAA family ATPase [Mesorhizobium sp. M1328]|uniref:ATP-dependent nuclease n=1 Tax=Mesorhizobium sp. M1328 TaxID=2957082 RepID=UPI00333E0D00